jgi:4-amino-4-deoxy-L-arabinose transferase-like glycosyltransferase
MAARLQHQAWIVAVGLAVFFVNLGGSRLWDDDETKNATCAREMFLRGDWVVPTFNSELRTDKPPLAYWLMIGAYQVFGVTEFAARLPSAILALGTTLATYHLGRLLFGPRAGLWGSAILATSLMFVWIGRAATPDSALIFCTTAALLMYVWSLCGGREGGFLSDWKSIPPGEFAMAMPRSTAATVAMYALLGLAVLAKGPIGVLLPCATIGLFMLTVCVRSHVRTRPPERTTLASLSVFHLRRCAAQISEAVRWSPATLRAMRPLLLAATVLAVALPWYLLVSLRTNSLWPQGFFLTHNFERFLQPIGGHRGGIFFHPLVLMGGFFPWTFLLPVGISQLVRRVRSCDPRAAAYLFLAIWALVWFVFFSICETKLPNYVLPAYPALAIIGGAWVADRVAMPARRTIRLWLCAQWVSLAVFGALLWVVSKTILPRWMPEAAGFAWLGLILIVGAGSSWILHRRGNALGAFGSLVVSTVLLLVAAFTVAAPAVSRRQNGTQLAEALRRMAFQPDRIAMYRVGDAGFIYYTDSRCQKGSEDCSGVQSMFAHSDRPLLVTDEEGYASIRSLLPADARIVGRQPRWLRSGDIVFVGRQADELANRNEAATDYSLETQSKVELIR